MGYTTFFDGSFTLTPSLTPDQARYINCFSSTRRMKRDPELLPSEGLHSKVGLSLGHEGGYYVEGEGYFGTSVLDSNEPPEGQPGLWCQWVTNDVGPEWNILEWDGSEKFYAYEVWLQYLIDHFFTPWGVTVSGMITYAGSDHDDRGTLVVSGSKVSKIPFQLAYDEDAEYEEAVDQ